MNLLKTIINQMGFVDAEQCKELACYFPNAELIIQWGYLPREACRAVEVANRIKSKTFKGTMYAKYGSPQKPYEN